MPTPEQAYQQLVRRGIMPTDAQRIVDRVAAREDALITQGEAELVAIFSPEDVEADKLWIFYTPDIPDAYRRLWTATTEEQP